MTKTIDLTRVRAALTRGYALAAARPELFKARDGADWTSILETDEGDTTMAEETWQTWQTAIRIPLSIVAQVDAFSDAWKASNPGVQLTRSDAIRLLIVRGLEASSEKKGQG